MVPHGMTSENIGVYLCNIQVKCIDVVAQFWSHLATELEQEILHD